MTAEFIQWLGGVGQQQRSSDRRMVRDEDITRPHSMSLLSITQNCTHYEKHALLI
jgi:hypothetical protein